MESPLDYCNAVVSGGLSEVVCNESGVIVDWQTELQMQGRKIRRRSSSQSPPARAWDRILGGLRTRRRKHRVGYTPYYELVPNLIEPFGSVAVIPPIFAVSMGDVELYSSVKWAELDTEPWETLSSPYDLILDSQGRMLQAVVPEGKIENWTVIGSVGPETDHQADLRRLVLESRAQAGTPQEDVVDESLTQLLARAVENVTEWT